MKIDVDMSEVRALVLDLRELPGRVQREVPQAIAKGAQNITERMRSEMEASAHFGQIARTITYDLHDAGTMAEIGPVKGGPGSLANIAYFGGGAWSGRRTPGPGWQQGPGGGGTVADPRGALEAEGPNVERDILDMVARLVGR